MTDRLSPSGLIIPKSDDEQFTENAMTAFDLAASTTQLIMQSPLFAVTPKLTAEEICLELFKRALSHL